MDQNETLNQLANNPQMLNQLIQTMQQNPQMLNQLIQTMQQNGMVQPNQKTPANWNMPTSPMMTNAQANPMMALWLNNMMNSVNNQGNNQTQQQSIQNDQKPEDTIIPVRVVKSQDDIRVDQIPMNDKISLFMQDDMSVIYGKRWTNDGTIATFRFVLDATSAPSGIKMPNGTVANNQNINIDELMSAVTNVIDNKLDQFKKEFYSDNNGQQKNRNNRK